VSKKVSKEKDASGDASRPHNPFPVPSALDGVLLTELVEVARRCYDRGWSHGTAGNFSLRGKGGVIWQSPTGLNKGALDPRAFIAVDLASGRTIVPQSPMPSLEMPVHLGIYREIGPARCVVHTHPLRLVEKSRAGKDLTFKGEEMVKALGAADHLKTLTIPVITNPTPAEMPALADSVGDELNPAVPMVVLAGHGVYAWGPTPMAALAYIEAAEHLCSIAHPPASR